MVTRKILQLILSITLIPSVTFSGQQALSAVSGSIVDHSGQRISGARVIVSRKGQKIDETESDKSGEWTLSNIPMDATQIRVLFGGSEKRMDLTPVFKAAGANAVPPPIQLMFENITLVKAAPNATAPPAPAPPPPVPGANQPNQSNASAAAIWNAWAQEPSSSPTVSPLDHLQPDHDYELFVHLAGVSYESDGVASAPVSDPLRDWLLKYKGPVKTLDIYMFPDTSYFESADPASKQFDVDLKKMRVWIGQPKLPNGQSALEILAHDSEPNFLFGRTKGAFQIRTTNKQGWGSVALSFWVDQSVPVGELVLPICISTDSNQASQCPDAAKVYQSFNGVDSFKVATQRAEQGKGFYPDAALDFVELKSDKVIAVFRCNNCTDWKSGELKYWPLKLNVVDLSQALAMNMDKFSHANLDEDLNMAGKDLYDELLPNVSDDKAKDAQDAFKRFVQSHLLADDDVTKIPTSIFVRLLSQKRSPVLIPLGLMLVDLGGGKKEFLGKHFRIETPLENQDYTTTSSCISNWVMLVPPEAGNEATAELSAARKQFIGDIQNWPDPPAKSYDSLLPFYNWVNDRSPQTESVGLMILSHHDGNKGLYFAQPEKALSAAAFQKEFMQPSVAIINACGAISPGATSIVNQLSVEGISSVIASATTVKADMAGNFLDLFLKRLMKNKDDVSYTIGRARFDAVRDLYDTPATQQNGEGNYGIKALVYSLIGNGGLRLCPALQP